jgi:aryl-alcohol dehydrogenase-like predicted oxidoreductase
MKQRRLGNTDLEVSALGLGTVELGMPYGIGNPAPPPDAQCIYLLRWAFDQGITFFDTAAGYGRSEELLGRAFGGASPRPTIATKVTVYRAEDDKLLAGKELASHLEHSLLSSLNLLGAEELDLLQVHAPGQGAFIGPDLLELMDSYTRRGLVRHWGASTYGPEQPGEALAHAPPIRTLQVAYNLLDRGLAEVIFPSCQSLGVGVVLRSVFLKGALSHRLDALPERLGPLRRAGQQARALAEELGLSLADLALRFAASQERADVVLVGTADLGELAANLKAFAAGPLPGPVRARIGEIAVEDQALLNPGNWGIYL